MFMLADTHTPLPLSLWMFALPWSSLKSHRKSQENVQMCDNRSTADCTGMCVGVCVRARAGVCAFLCLCSGMQVCISLWCVCVCVRICKLLFMLIFERVFRPVVMECFWKSLYCFCTGSWKSVCPRPEFCRRGLHFLTQTEMCLAARRAQTLRIRGLLLLLLHPHFTLSPSSYYLSNSLFLSVCLSRSGADKAHIQRVFAVGWWSLY